MATFRFTSRTLIFLSLSAIICCNAHGKIDDDSRLKQATEQLETSKSILAQTTNEVERTQWAERVKVAETELVNTKRLVELEEKEKNIDLKRRTTAEFALREVLGTIETNAGDAEREAKSLNSKIRSLRSQRADLEREAKKTGENPDTEAASKANAQSEAQIRNLDTELLAYMLQRDAAENQIRLARAADRIDATCRTNLPNPRVTIPMIIQQRDAIHVSDKNRREFDALRAGLESQLKDTTAANDLSQQKFKHLDSEIVLLREGYRSSRKARSNSDTVAHQARLRRMLDVAESEKDLMVDRLKYQGLQCAALEKSIGIASQASDLLAAEKTYLEHTLSLMKRKYLTNIVSPVLWIFFLCITYSVVSRYVLPILYHRDALFIARRLGNYILVLLIFIVIVSTFLEDLRSIATVLGIVGAAVVIALQDLCSAFAGWFVIIASGKLKVGDRVEIDGKKGDIIDIQLLRTTLSEVDSAMATGRIVIFPNSFIFKHHVFNSAHIHRSIWDKIEITVTYGTPLRQASDLLWRILEEETKEEFDIARRGEALLERAYGARHGLEKPRIDTIIADSGVCFRLIYATRYEMGAVTRNRLMAKILDEFEKNPAIQLAYPTFRQFSTVIP